jgi:hypothetical protein
MTPQVAGAVFAVTLAFMLLFPFVRLSLDGSASPETLLFLTKTDFGVNVFALVLILMPIAGIAASLILRESRALLADAILALVGVVMIPLTIITAGHEAGTNSLLAAHVSIGIGMIPIVLMLAVIAIGSGIAAFRS